MSLQRITSPTSYAVNVAEAKAFCRIRGSTAEDYLIRGILQAVESYGENLTKRSFMPQQWRLKCDNISDELELPRGPLSSAATAVSLFTYMDSSGGTNSMPSTSYTVDGAAEPPRIYRTYDRSWPSGVISYTNAVSVEYWTGYPSRAGVPEAIKTWIKVRTGAYYENREALMVGTGNFISELPRSYVDGLLDEFCLIKVC